MKSAALYKSKALPSVATYVVAELHQNVEQADTAHLRLELEVDRMSSDERKAAADALRRALGLLEKGDQV